VESKAENISCSHSTARFSNAAIRNKAHAQDAKFSCAESIDASFCAELLFYAKISHLTELFYIGNQNACEVTPAEN
jgi:hypothetical protein